jgi:hypothetical protein
LDWYRSISLDFSIFRSKQYMVGVGLLPIIRILKKAVSDVHQPWYANDAGAGGRFQRIRGLYFKKLQEYGHPRGYFPEPSKSILIV